MVKDLAVGDEIVVDGVKYKITQKLDSPVFKKTTNFKVRRYYVGQMIPHKVKYQISQAVSGRLQVYGHNIYYDDV
jgi:hypothetical protein